MRYTDLSSLLEMHAHPFSLGAEAAWLHNSPLGPIIGHFLGVDTKLEILIFYGIIAVITLAVLAWYSKNLFALLWISPLIHVILFWIGKSDTLLILSYLLFAIATSPILITGGVFFMILAHKEQAMLILLIHGILFREYWKFLPVMIGAGLAFTFFGIQSYVLGDYPTRADYLFNDSVTWSFWTPLLTFGWFLIPTLYVAWKERSWAILSVVAFIIVFTTGWIGDHTRPAAMLSLPVYLYVLHYFKWWEPKWWQLVGLAILGLTVVEDMGWGFLGWYI